MAPFLQIDETQEIYCEFPRGDQWAPKYMPREEVGVRYTVIPSDSDIARIGTLSNKERELVDEIKWRFTHQGYSYEELQVVSPRYSPWNSIAPSSTIELFSGLTPEFTELRRGYENMGREKRPTLCFEKDQDRFLYPRMRFLSYSNCGVLIR